MSNLPRTLAWIRTGFIGGVLTAASLVLILAWSPVAGGEAIGEAF